MTKAYDIRIVSFSSSVLHLKIDGKVHDIDLSAQSSRLAQATQQQIENVVVSPSGYGLHWPEVDEDLCIDGLINSKLIIPPGQTIR